MMGSVQPLVEEMSTSTDPERSAVREAKDRHAAFIASLQDVTGVFIYFEIARALLL